MISIEESVATAMDYDDAAILSYLPYILQDFWEIGSSADSLLNIVKENKSNYSNLEILDLGCGKGAVSIKLASELKCNCFGVDAIEDFILEAKLKAHQYSISSKCKFEFGDARIRIKDLGKFDVIILGSIGPVFGNYFETLTLLKKNLSEDGIIILDDGYVDDNKSYIHPNVVKRTELLQQIDDAKMQVLQEYIDLGDNKRDEYELEYNYIKKRCSELIEKYPEKKKIFEDYIIKQKEEYNHLENDLICSTMVIGFK